MDDRQARLLQGLIDARHRCPIDAPPSPGHEPPMTVYGAPDTIDLARFIRPGDAIVWGQACGEPTTLIAILIAQAATLGGLSAFAGSSFSGLLTPALCDHVALASMGAIGALRTIARAGRLAIIPVHVGQVGAMIACGLIPCDVAFVQVSRVNAQGQHSYGLINDYVQAAVAKARVVIAEINDQVPFTYGDAYLAHDRIDVAVTVSRQPVEVRGAVPGAIDRAVAGHIAGYIGDGAVLQIGIGTVPDAVLQLLGDRRDLGIHSGMIGDGLVDLVAAGAVTNACKARDRGVCVTGALIGSRRLYDFADGNPAVRLCASGYTHSDAVLTTIAGLVSINSAIEVDLTGQVNAEQTPAGYLGATGGQVDTVRGGARAPGGRSIIALPATVGGGVSRVVAALHGPVTTARSEVDVIVTEFGAAELKGRSLADRARQMVAIAHPDHRAALDEAAHAIRQRGF